MPIKTVDVIYDKIPLKITGIYMPESKGDNITPTSPASFEIHDVYYMNVKVTDLISILELHLINTNKHITWSFWDEVEQLIINQLK